ncbi:MAG: hypothetical protein ACLRXC_12270 [[Clostridium] leptum]
MVGTYRRRSDYVYGRLVEMGEVQKPQGALSVPIHSKIRHGFETFCLRMIQEANWRYPAPVLGRTDAACLTAMDDELRQCLTG